MATKNKTIEQKKSYNLKNKSSNVERMSKNKIK